MTAWEERGVFHLVPPDDDLLRHACDGIVVASNPLQSTKSLPAPVIMRFGTSTILACCVTLISTSLAAQSHTPANSRFGRWLLKSDAPAPSSNIMTYESFGAAGMKVTIQAVNAKGDTTRWWYTTDFDGKEMPVTGNAGQSHAAVRVIDPFVNEIINKKDGRVTTRLTNVLSPDGQTIAVIYMRDDGAGRTTGVTFATYERMR